MNTDFDAVAHAKAIPFPHLQEVADAIEKRMKERRPKQGDIWRWNPGNELYLYARVDNGKLAFISIDDGNRLSDPLPEGELPLLCGGTSLTYVGRASEILKVNLP